MTVPQSQFQVDSIEAYDPAGPVVVSYGATVPSGATFTINGNANFTGIVTTGSHSGTDVNVSSGIVTASSFVGSASGFTNLPVLDDAKSIAFTLIG
jgi:hypothetical protein